MWPMVSIMAGYYMVILQAPQNHIISRAKQKCHAQAGLDSFVRTYCIILQRCFLLLGHKSRTHHAIMTS